MFDTYDNIDKIYEVRYADGTVDNFTTQELYEMYVFRDIGVTDFYSLKNRVDSGEAVEAYDQDFDWGLGRVVSKGKMIIKKTEKIEYWHTYNHNVTSGNDSRVSIAHLGCDHKDKYVNFAGGKKFYVCPKCKADLGDA